MIHKSHSCYLELENGDSFDPIVLQTLTFMNKQGKLLIVDDNKSVLSSLQLYLKNKFEEVICCANPNQIQALMGMHSFDVVLLDMNFSAGVNSGNEGLFWLKEILKIDANLVVILFTAYGEVKLAVDAMKYGASDFILKPWDNKKLLATLKTGVNLHQSRSEVENLKHEKKQLQQDLSYGFEHFIGKSEVMKKVFATIDKVAKTDANILILGENGTGKELVARAIHKRSLRSNKLFMSVDLGAISESLFESELFGHLKGAFTDAKEDRKGRFQVASGGSLFLDEIGNLSAGMQTKLLTVLQNREITPLGGNRAEAIDVRLICATNKNLGKMISEGGFREDLLYRINTILIELPSLKERGGDVIVLAEHFLKYYADKYGKAHRGLNASAKEKLENYSWPGNVRELRHAMERAIILSEQPELIADDFLLETRDTSINFASKAMSMEEAETILITHAMKRNKGNISHVAKELNIGRQTLYRKIEKYGI